jgi:hypothetical protein
MRSPRVPVAVALSSLVVSCLGPLHAARAESVAEQLIPDCKRLIAHLDENDGWLWKVDGCGKTVWCLYGGQDMHCMVNRPETDNDRQEKVRLAEGRRRLELAAAALRCPTEKVHFDDLAFEAGDPLLSRWDWVEAEAIGCGRVVWCSAPKVRDVRCQNTDDFDTAAAQLALETQCPVEQIEQVQRQVFTKRAWDAQRREVRGQISWRLNACGRAYVCAVTAGMASNVSCKAALDSAQPEAPPASGN